MNLNIVQSNRYSASTPSLSGRRATSFSTCLSVLLVRVREIVVRKVYHLRCRRRETHSLLRNINGHRNTDRHHRHRVLVSSAASPLRFYADVIVAVSVAEILSN